MNIVVGILGGLMLYITMSALNQARIYFTMQNKVIYTQFGYKKTLFGWSKPKTK